MGTLLEKLLGLSSGLDAESQTRPILSNQWLPAWILLAILVFVFIYYRRFYRKDGRRLERWQVRTLTGIRIALVLLVVLMILRPALNIIHQEERLPVVAMLVDESTSMTLPAGRENPLIPYVRGQDPKQRSRYAAATEGVARLQEALTRTHRVKLYTFSDTLNLVRDIAYRGDEEGALATSPQEVQRIREALKPPTGEHSDIFDAVTRTLEELKESKVSAVVLYSDGRSTEEGEAMSQAVQAAREQGIAVHTLTCGSQDPIPDLAIEHLMAPEEANLNDILALRVTIINHLRPQLAVELKILEEGQLLSTEKLVLDEGRNDRVLTLIPRVAGERSFRIQLPEFRDDEYTLENNAKDFSVTVIEREMRVLFIAGIPTIEYHFIVPALIRDPIINVSCWLQSADIDYLQQGNTIIERLPRTVREWEEYHVVILYDIDPNQFNNQHETGLEALIRDAGGLLVIAGRSHGVGKLLQVRGARMHALLPVEVDKNRTPEYDKAFEDSFQAERTTAGKRHPIFQFEMSRATNDAVWMTLPRFYWHHPVLRAKRTAVSLLEKMGAPDGRGDVLMAMHRYGKGVVFFSSLQTLWRWRYPYENYDYDRFWSQLVRYLGEAKLLGTQKQVVLYTDKATYSPGEDVQISLTVLDPALLTQLQSESLVATVTEENGAELRMPMRLVSREQSEYRALYHTRRVGNYEVNVRHALARGSSDQKPLFDESRPFLVELQSLEFRDTTADPETLRQLAADTGGTSLDEESLGRLTALAEVIPTDRQYIPHETTEDFWDSSLFLIIFLGLIGCEWVLRKRWDLL